MRIEVNFQEERIRKEILSKKQAWYTAVINAYKVACIEMVKRAKATRTYQDRTGKLRASIGAVLFCNGKEVFNFFDGGEGAMAQQGSLQGLGFARKKAGEGGNHPIVAVVVAGAEYARYVESKGLDVITGSSFSFKSDVEQEMSSVTDAFTEHISETLGL